MRKNVNSDVTMNPPIGVIKNKEYVGVFPSLNWLSALNRRVPKERFLLLSYAPLFSRNIGLL